MSFNFRCAKIPSKNWFRKTETNKFLRVNTHTERERDKTPFRCDHLLKTGRYLMDPIIFNHISTFLAYHHGLISEDQKREKEEKNTKLVKMNGTKTKVNGRNRQNRRKVKEEGKNKATYRCVCICSDQFWHCKKRETNEYSTFEID